MKKNLIVATGLLLLTVGLGIAAYTSRAPLILNLFLTAFTLAVVYIVFSVLIGNFVIRQITDSKTRYTANKVISILSAIILLVLIIRIWVADPSALLVSLGIIGAGIAIALQDVFKNFAGGILLIISNPFRVGDRISIDGQSGDVMDIGMMNTTLMEIRGWINGDQPTGRLLVVPNAFVINRMFYNYTKDHSFIWDEITIPLTHESDWKKAKGIVLAILQKETSVMTSHASKEIARIGETYYLPESVVDPDVYVSLTDTGVVLHARYVSDVWDRRLLNSRLNQLILDALEKEETVHIAKRLDYA